MNLGQCEIKPHPWSKPVFETSRDTNTIGWHNPSMLRPKLTQSKGYPTRYINHSELFSAPVA